MEEIKAPKKERKFLKAIENIGKVLAEELVMGIARKFIGKTIDKVGNKKQGLVIAFIVLASSFAFAQFPTNTNKQRLGFQTTADGLVWRGSLSDTASIQPVSNQNAWVILDTVNLKIYSFDFTSNVWGLVGGGSAAFTQPIDSLFFKTSVPPNNVDTAKMRWDNELGTVVLGMYDAVPNELGFKNFWLVKNQTGSTIAKNTLVYASGTVGSSGRISVSKFIANGTINAKYLLGITAHDLSNGEDGYVISFGKIRQVKTDTFAAGAILYPSPTMAGVWTDVEPVAPNLDMPIGFCINSHVNNGTIAIRYASGYKLSELHDLAISSPVTNASLYYSGGLWRDTTPTLLLSDTAAMLANYATKAYADTSGRFYARQDFTNVSSSTLTWTQSDTLVVGGTGVVQVYRNGQILLPTQYTIPTNASVVIGSTAYKAGENYTVIFPRGGGAGSGGGSGSLTSISGGTGIIVNPNPITTTGTVSADLSVLMELTDTSLLNLNTRFASKLNPSDTISLSNRINAKGTGTVTSVGSGFGLLGGTITMTGTLRLDTTTIYARLQDSINVAIGNDTIKILKQEYQPALSSVLTWTITPKFPIQLKAYILVFRNGQLLNNDQYNLTDTNKITIVSTSFKIGANYTVATVSGIGSVGSAQAGNPIYPEAGIALSTGSTWASSITNNSSNWNTAFTDRLKWDGGSTGLVASTGRTSLGGTTIGQSMFTLTNPSAITFPRFNSDNTVSALTAANFRTAIGAGTVTNVIASTTAGNPISIDNNTTTPTIELLSATSARNGYLTSTDWTTFSNKQAALGFTPANSTITLATTTPLQGGGNLTANRTLSITQATTSANGFLTSTDWNTFNSKQNTLVSGTTIKTVNGTTLLGSGNLSVGTLVGTDTVSLSNRINLKVNISDTAAMLLPYLRKVDTTAMLLPYFKDNDTTLLNLSSRFNAKVNLSDTLNMLAPYLRKADTTNMLLPYFRDSDTSLLNLTNRFNAKLNISDTTLMLSKYLRKLDTINLSNRINLKLNISDTASMLLPYLKDADTSSLNLNARFNAKVNISDTTNMLLPYLRKTDTTNMLLPYLRKADTSLLNLTSRFNTKLNISDTLNMLSKYLRKADTTSMLLPYFRDADTSLLNLTNRFAAKLNISDTLNMLSKYLRRADTTLILLPYLRKADTTNMLSPYFRDADTSLLNLTNRFNTKLNISDTTNMLSKYLRRADTTLMLLPYLRKTDTTNMLLPYFRDADTSSLNLTSRLNTKLNISDTTSMLLPYFRDTDTTILNLSTRFNTKLNLSDTLNMLSKYLRKADTTSMLLPYFKKSDTTQLNLTSRFAAKQNNITLTTTGTSGLATFNGTTLNIPNYTSSGGTGTVTSVGLTAPSIFNVSGSPVTTSGTLSLTYSGTALPLLNGGTGATTADGALTNLGATAQGKLLFGLQNTVTEKFIKVNTNNTITLLNADDTRSAIGAGTVTSVTATSPMVSSGGTTPNLSMPAAATNVSGYVSHLGDQYFTGNKFFWGSTTMLGVMFFKDYTYQATRLAGLSLTDRFATVTLGSGLSLSGGVLSATSGGVTSVTASIPLSSSGGATPNITIADAGASASGVVNTTTQSFAGNKTFTGTLNVSSTGTFGGRVNTPWIERTYTNTTSSSFTVSVNTTWLDINTSVLTTLTLPNAATYPGKELHIRQTGAGQLQSASSNIIPFTVPPNGSTSTGILQPSNNRAVTLVSDGSNWIIMQRSTN
jgi:hypothetical protein